MHVFNYFRGTTQPIAQTEEKTTPKGQIHQSVEKVSGLFSDVFGSKKIENPVIVGTKKPTVSTEAKRANEGFVDIGKVKRLAPSTSGNKEMAVSEHPLTGIASKQGAVSPSGQAINVPDDGNCLHYALAVGLRKKYFKFPEIQDKLQWSITPNRLVGDLGNVPQLLEEPGDTLRQQAATYLEENLDNDEMMLALFGGIIDHNEIAQRKIENDKSAISILEEDLNELKRMMPTDDVKQQLKQKQEQIKGIKESIAFQEKHLAREEDLQQYINMTKEDHVYCGTPQILALCKKYDIPVRVLFNYNRSNQFEQIFNEKAQATKPVLTLAHVNGNHFQYVDD
jgi:hypothetical protein